MPRMTTKAHLVVNDDPFGVGTTEAPLVDDIEDPPVPASLLAGLPHAVSAPLQDREALLAPPVPESLAQTLRDVFVPLPTPVPPAPETSAPPMVGEQELQQEHRRAALRSQTPPPVPPDDASCLSCGHGHGIHRTSGLHACLSPACPCTAWNEPRPDAPFVLSQWKDQLLLLVDQAMWKHGEQVVTGMRLQDEHITGMITTLSAQQSGLQALAASVGTHTPVVPYSVAIAVISPGGFPMTFTVQERTHEAFLGAVGALVAMLRDEGFAPMTGPFIGA